MQEAQLMESKLYRSILTKGAVQLQAATIHKLLVRWLGSVDASLRPRIEAYPNRDLINIWYDEALELNDAKSARKLLDKILRTPVPPSADGSSQAA